MSIDKGNIDELLGRDVYGTEGEKIGSAGQVFLDDATGRPEWVTVKTGLFGTKESFVPLQRADLSDRGLQVAYDKDRIKDAPRQDTGEGTCRGSRRASCTGTTAWRTRARSPTRRRNPAVLTGATRTVSVTSTPPAGKGRRKASGPVWVTGHGEAPHSRGRTRAGPAATTMP